MIACVGRARADDFRLSNPPVVEALAEIHFSRVSNLAAYGPIPGRMFERLQPTYVQAADLDAASLPLTLEPGLSPEGRMVRHRFSSADGQQLFQVGNGIVTVNCLRYETYAVFRSQVLAVYRHAVELLGEPTRAILRYINKIPTGGLDAERVLLFGTALPPDPAKQWIRRQATASRHIEGVGELTMTWAVPVDGHRDLLLFDLLLTSPPFGANAVDELPVWMDEAHREVEDEFLNDLQPDFLEGLK